MDMLDLNILSVAGHPIPKDATYAEHKAYCEGVLKLPGPVDRWLTANSRCPRIGFLQDYLMLEEVQTEYVTCVVEREYPEVSAAPFHICFKLRCQFNLTFFCQPGVHSLHLTAYVSAACPAILFVRKSPRVVLECFVGSNRAIHAPEWTRWKETSRQFQQPKTNFATLFVRIAGWNESRHIVRRRFQNFAFLAECRYAAWFVFPDGSVGTIYNGK